MKTGASLVSEPISKYRSNPEFDARLIRAIREYADKNGCAPTTKTAGADILQIQAKVSRAFFMAARKRSDEINFRILNRIILKFLNVWENFGESVFQEHLEFELSYLAKNGLRTEYKHELDFINRDEGLPPVSEYLVSPSNLSSDLLFAVFDDALMKPVWDKCGDVRLSEHGCYVMPAQDNELIRFRVNTMFLDVATQTKRLECANNITMNYLMLRAVALQDGTLRLEHDICVAGGITKENLIATAKRFVQAPMAAIKEFASGLVI